ncbi:hypothetical protein MMC25_008259 [Agyrium rufum]|nr:hypothetical protein [Agyrium rufum]
MGVEVSMAPRAPRSTWSSKNIALIALTIQNSTLILVLFYSRNMPAVAGSHRYFASTAVFLAEALKLGVCLTASLYEISRTTSPNQPATALFTTLTSAVLTKDSWKLAIPATLYTLQNSLQFVAISNLDAATMQVTNQFKILPTALFSVLLLRRSLSGRRWIALGLLMLGVAIVQIPVYDPSKEPLGDSGSSSFSFPRSVEHWRAWTARPLAPNPPPAIAPFLTKRSATYEGIVEDHLLEHPVMNAQLGLAAALIGCTVAALASVYFEKVLKESQEATSIWVRNVQLSLYSLFPAFFIGVAFVDGEQITKSGFFVGYNEVVWTAIVLQAVGGILVALCVQLADTITKSFATSISILISLVASMIFFDFTLTTNFLFGTMIVMFATYLYNTNDRDRPSPIQIHDYEKTTIDTQSSRLKAANGHFRPLTPPAKSEGQSSSRPGTPLLKHSRSQSTLGYFAAKRQE